MKTLTAKMLRERFFYDPNTGVFSRLTSKRRWLKGSIAGFNRNHDRAINIDGVYYSEHRLAWLYMTGKWPRRIIDHIDGNPKNNIFANLRECSIAQNSWNSKNRKSNSSGIKGVHWLKREQKWAGKVTANGIVIRTKLFDEKEEAASAVQQIRNHLHGEFVNHG